MRRWLIALWVPLLLAGCDDTGQFDLPLGPDSHDNADSSIKLEGGAVVNVDQIVNVYPPINSISGPPAPSTLPADTPPVLVNPGPQTSTVGDFVNLQLTVSPGSTLSGTSCPRDLSIDNKGLISGPVSSSSALDPQPFTCIVTALLNGMSTTVAFAWTILPTAEA